MPDMDSWKLTMEDHTKSLEFLEFIRSEATGPAAGSSRRMAITKPAHKRQKPNKLKRTGRRR